MVHICAVPLCYSRKGRDKGISFHEFPSNQESRDKWIKNVRRKNWYPKDSSRVCSLHFEESCYEIGLKIKKLKKDSIPTIFTGFPSYLKKDIINSSVKQRIMQKGQPPTKQRKVLEMMESSKCYLCLDKLQSIRKYDTEMTSNFMEQHLKNCRQHLNLQLEFQEYFEDKTPPFCSTCFDAVEKMRGIINKLEEVQMELKTYAENLTAVLSNLRTVNGNQPFIYDIPNPDSPSFQDDDNYGGDISFEFNEDNSDDVKIEVDDVKIKLDDEIVSPENETSTMKSFDKELRINIERLNFDSNGKLIANSHKALFYCSLCDKLLIGRSSIVRHKRIHSKIIMGKKGFECKDCGKIFDRKSKFFRHQASAHQSERPFKCSYCPKDFKLREDMRDHEKGHIVVGRPFKCNICNAAFRWNRNLRSHERFVHNLAMGNKVGECKPLRIKKMKAKIGSRCKLTISTSGDLKNEIPKVLSKGIRKPKPQKPLLENETPKVRSKRIRKRKPQKPISDDDLTEIPNRRAKKSHGAVRKTFTCEICGRTIRGYLRNLEDHKRLHSGEKPFKCDLCEMSFRTVLLRKDHVAKVHVEGFPAPCQQCEQKFKTRPELSKHCTTHHPTVDKLFVCEECGRPFKWKSDLKLHVIRHHSTTREKCDHCDKTFVRPSDKCVHTKIHHPNTTNENGVKFVCRFCSKPFYFKRKLDDHERTHTGEKPFKCDTCGKYYTSKTRLSGHRRDGTCRAPQ